MSSPIHRYLFSPPGLGALPGSGGAGAGGSPRQRKRHHHDEAAVKENECLIGGKEQGTADVVVGVVGVDTADDDDKGSHGSSAVFVSPRIVAAASSSWTVSAATTIAPDDGASGTSRGGALVDPLWTDSQEEEQQAWRAAADDDDDAGREGRATSSASAVAASPSIRISFAPNAATGDVRTGEARGGGMWDDIRDFFQLWPSSSSEEDRHRQQQQQQRQQQLLQLPSSSSSSSTSLSSSRGRGGLRAGGGRASPYAELGPGGFNSTLDYPSRSGELLVDSPRSRRLLLPAGLLSSSVATRRQASISSLAAVAGVEAGGGGARQDRPSHSGGGSSGSSSSSASSRFTSAISDGLVKNFPSLIFTRLARLRSRPSLLLPVHGQPRAFTPLLPRSGKSSSSSSLPSQAVTLLVLLLITLVAFSYGGLMAATSLLFLPSSSSLSTPVSGPSSIIVGGQRVQVLSADGYGSAPREITYHHGHHDASPRPHAIAPPPRYARRPSSLSAAAAAAARMTPDMELLALQAYLLSDPLHALPLASSSSSSSSSPTLDPMSVLGFDVRDDDAWEELRREVAPVVVWSLGGQSWMTRPIINLLSVYALSPEPATLALSDRPDLAAIQGVVARAVSIESSSSSPQRSLSNPLITIGGKPIDGLEALLRLHDAGELGPMLERAGAVVGGAKSREEEEAKRLERIKGLKYAKVAQHGRR